MLASYAGRYARLGWQMIATCQTPDGDRKPILRMSPLQATSDPAQLERILQWPWVQGIAVLTGERSGIFGIDADEKDGKDGIDQLDELFAEHGMSWKHVVRSETPSGGLHAFFRWDNRLAEARNLGCLLTNKAGTAKRHGLEVKLRNSLLTLPPSDYGSGRYRWARGRSPFDIAVPKAPEWLIELILNPPVDRRRASLSRRRSRGRRDSRPDRWLARNARVLQSGIASLSIGSQRNEANRQIFAFAARHGRAAHDYAGDLVRAVLAMEADGRRGPWTQSQAERLVADALDAGSKRYGG